MGYGSVRYYVSLTNDTEKHMEAMYMARGHHESLFLWEEWIGLPKGKNHCKKTHYLANGSKSEKRTLSFTLSFLTGLPH